MTTILWQGDFYRLNSFSLVNQNLIKALKNRGVDITLAPTDRYQKIVLEAPPDIYVFHNYPYDVIQAPGIFNIFYIPYEYFEFYERDYFLAEGINSQFDMMVVPSEFTKRACIKSGVQIPIQMIPEGYNPEEFNPNIPPIDLPTNKKFKFLNLGGTIFRKGHDLLVQAYLEEFTNNEDVVLVIKAFSYAHEIDWFKGLLTKHDKIKNSPEILFDPSEPEQIGGYYTATDIGVYPYRGEGFGLTILESIACGCPVVVTQGGSTDDFCNKSNARFIRSKQEETDGQIYLEPSINHLKELMRKVCTEGKISFDKQEEIHKTALPFTWDESAKKWELLFQEILGVKKESRPIPSGLETGYKISLIFSDYDDQLSPWKEYAPQKKRMETLYPWKESKSEIVDKMPEFRSSFQILQQTDRKTRINPSDTVLGDSGFSYEYFSWMKKLNPHTRFILFHNHFPVDVCLDLENQERKRLGINYKEHPRYQSLLYWRYKRELKMAKEIILLDSLSENYFLQQYQPLVTHLVTPPIPQHSFIPSTTKKITFLFWGFDPFRQGIRVLFEAWNDLQLKNAELLCILETQLALSSKQLIKFLVLNSTIKILDLPHSQKYKDYLSDCDVQVLPTLGDGFFLPAALGLSMGRPLVTTDKSGMKDIIGNHDFGYIAQANSSESLAAGIMHYYDMMKSRRHEIGQSASTHMEEYSKENFAGQILRILIN